MENNKIVNIESQEEEGNIKITTDTALYSERFYFSEIYDDKVYKKFIKNVERLIRTSNEYNDYIYKLRSNFSALNRDNILSNITAIDADMEFHHYPFTLYDIVDSVASYKIINDEKFTSFSLAKEIMNLHYKNMIGLVPLTKTTHEMAHKNLLFISKEQIFGQWKKFFIKYNAGISAEHKKMIEKLESAAETTPSDWLGLL